MTKRMQTQTEGRRKCYGNVERDRAMTTKESGVLAEFKDKVCWKLLDWDV